MDMKKVLVEYIFIDDENNKSVESIINGLNDTGEVHVTQLTLSSNDGLESLTEKIKEKINLESENKVYGILIDLCLNGEGTNSIRFTASPIAQHLRTLASTTHEIPNIPLVLCSTIEKIKNTYNLDKACHDLYDYKFSKASDIKWEKVAKKMNALAIGYAQLNTQQLPLKQILNRNDFENLDNRIFESIENLESTYEIAHFLIKDLFQHPGPLIKETMVAARLGIDINKSCVAWKSLLKYITPQIHYDGIFSNGWDRYWMDQLDTLFKDYSKGNPLSTYTAKERVEIIKKATQIDGLQVAEPIDFCSSTYYNTICEALKRPIDSLEAYEVYEAYDLRSWQEPKYLSFYALASGGNNGIQIKQTEIKRFNEDRELLRQIEAEKDN